MAAPRLALSMFVLMLAVITLSEGKKELDNNVFNQCVKEVKKCNLILNFIITVIHLI